MDIAVYAADAATEADHWWFVGRRHLFSAIIDHLKLPSSAEILDVGTSSGTNLRMLRELGFYRAQGVDQSPEAIQFCARKGFREVRLADVCALPFPDDHFDFILATDIIEHVDDDLSALRELRRVLKPGGSLLLTVPAFTLLWGHQDEVGHHKRRYRMRGLLNMFDDAGYLADRYFYFNYLLFLPILISRRLMQALRVRVVSESKVNTRWLNRLLALVFRLDVNTAPWVRPPFGVSALVVARRR